MVREVEGDSIDGFCGFCGVLGHKALNCTALDHLKPALVQKYDTHPAVEGPLETMFRGSIEGWYTESMRNTDAYIERMDARLHQAQPEQDHG